jgi:hypothetical protein
MLALIVALDSEYDAWMRAGVKRQRRWALAGTIAVVVAVLIVIVVGNFVGANLVEVGDDRALHAIESAGFRDVKLGGADALGCADAESSRHFMATNQRGQRVEGTVCCGLTGLAKGCTLRWDR